MQVSTLYPLCFLLVSPLCSALSIRDPATLHTNVSSGAVGETTKIPLIPKDSDIFTLTNEFPLQLEEIPTLMAATYAMRDLGLRDSRKDSIPKMSWTHPSFPGAVLTIFPALGQQELRVCFAIWIILYTARVMLQVQKYSGQYFTLYTGKPIGSMIVMPIGPGEAAPGQVNNSAMGVDASALSSFSTSTSRAGVSAGNDLRAEVSYVGESIERRDILMIMLWLILDLALQNTEPLQIWQFTHNAIGSQITTIWN